ncbi:MAG: hypothetical protein RMJ98_03410 [Myxococcales bacterium]|nr:hypothetical protein [Polyangiaceae bacterium]MDW8248337.1 hypothetical protein [Myxococcales bacterium]
MTKVLVSMGLASLLALGALQGCSDDSGDSAPTGGSSSGGSAGSGGSSAGSGGSSAGSGGGDNLYCGVKESELPSISNCDDPNASECAKAMCATTKAKDCKTILTDCYNDPGCNKAVACGAACRKNEPEADVVATCTPLAGSGLAKALAYKSCADGLKACGGNDSIKPD